MSSTKDEKNDAEANWIPQQFQKSAEALAKDAVKKFVKRDQVIGLGSGPMAAAIVREMEAFSEKETLDCIPSSLQIKFEAECSGLRIADEALIPEIDVVFDGADEIDSGYNMIKGGGGALFREKVIHSAAKEIVITAESNKYVHSFSWPVPIEVHPFAAHSVRKYLETKYSSKPRMRMLNEGYPYITENGNLVLDTSFDFGSLPDIPDLEKELKNIAGITQVGLFSRTADVYYKARKDGGFDLLRPNQARQSV